MIDEHVSSLTITREEILETERLTREQSRNDLWFEKKKNCTEGLKFWKCR